MDADRIRPVRWLRLTVLVGGLLSMGCPSDKPYTPFGAASATSEPQAPSPVAEPSASQHRVREAARAKPGTTRWQLGEHLIEAPKGNQIAFGLHADFDADGQEEAVSWVVERAAPTRGSLWWRPKGGKARRVFATPGYLPSTDQCRHLPKLWLTGPQTVTLDIRVQCSGEWAPGTTQRALIVLAPAATRPTVLAIRSSKPAPGETLNLKVDSRDQDGDGRDDVRLEVTLQARGSSQPASAQLEWLDRAAGISRRVEEPAASLARAATGEVVWSKSKKTAGRALQGVDAIRRLYASLCKESGAHHIQAANGEPFECGNLQPMVDRLARAEVHAAINQGNLLEAFACLTRDGWYHQATSTKERQALEGALIRASHPLEVSRVKTLEASPSPKGSSPRFSPLSFESTGALLVQTKDDLVRVVGDGTLEEPVDADAGPNRWPLTPTYKDGRRWQSIILACSRSEILLENQRNGRRTSPVVTRLLSPRPGLCEGAKPIPWLEARPVSLRGDKLEALVAGSLLGTLTGKSEAARGAPLSPDGSTLVSPSPLGLVVLRGKTTELWRGSALGQLSSLSDCVVSNDARAIACIRDGKVLFIPRPNG